MRIVALQAENVKRLRAVEITPEGDVVVIAGRNGQGKTSVLDSIWYVLGGGPATRETTQPIRHGEDHASASLDLGELVVTRTWKMGEDGETTTSLKVANHDGATYNSPQKMLDKLIGSLSFDPLAFTHLPAKEQVTTLLDLVDLGEFDPDVNAALAKGRFDERTEVGRSIKTLEGQLAGMVEPDEGLPDEELSTGEILAAQEAHQAELDEYEGAQTMREQLIAESQRAGDTVSEARESVARAQRVLDAAEAGLAEIMTALAEAAKRVDGMTPPEPVDFRARLAEVEATNAQIRDARAREGVVRRLGGFKTTWRELTDEINRLGAERATVLSEAAMPVEGLAFDETGVTYKGVPFAQCSAGEQLRISMGMAMAADPQIRVIRITDGSLLDTENMTLIGEMADSHDFQVWIERVDESGSVGVVIEDGAVVDSDA